MHIHRRIKTITHAVAVLALFVLQAEQVQAGLVSTDTVFQNVDIITTTSEDLLSMLDTQIVADQLLAQGVDPESIKQRVAHLTDAELLELQNGLQNLPAGGVDVLGAALLVFLVLVVTDIAGLTDIFPFIKKQ